MSKNKSSACLFPSGDTGTGRWSTGFVGTGEECTAGSQLCRPVVPVQKLIHCVYSPFS